MAYSLVKNCTREQPRKNWSSVLVCKKYYWDFQSLKVKMSISWCNCLNIFFITYYSIILIFFTRIFYDENYSRRFDIRTVASESMWHALLDVSKLYSADMIPIPCFLFLLCIFCLMLRCFRVSAFFDPMLLAIMTYTWSSIVISFFKIFFTLILIGSKSNVLCPLFSFYPCFFNGEL